MNLHGVFLNLIPRFDKHKIKRKWSLMRRCHSQIIDLSWIDEQAHGIWILFNTKRLLMNFWLKVWHSGIHSSKFMNPHRYWLPSKFVDFEDLWYGCFYTMIESLKLFKRKTNPLDIFEKKMNSSCSNRGVYQRYCMTISM